MSVVVVIHEETMQDFSDWYTQRAAFAFQEGVCLWSNSTFFLRYTEVNKRRCDDYDTFTTVVPELHSLTINIHLLNFPFTVLSNSHYTNVPIMLPLQPSQHPEAIHNDQDPTYYCYRGSDDERYPGSARKRSVLHS